MQQKECGGSWVNCVHSDLTVSETQQLWPGVEKGEMFPRCSALVHNITLAAWTWLHNSEHVNKKAREKNEGKEI